MLSARRRREGGADIDLPQLIERCVIEGRDGAIEKTEEYQAAAGRKRARGVRIGQMHVLLDLLVTGSTAVRLLPRLSLADLRTLVCGAASWVAALASLLHRAIVTERLVVQPFNRRARFEDERAIIATL